ncbi:DNA-dependent protein kinase catalytic subunit [Tetrabaena socialis]|uniref:DNA-dependent protein kinase catalytic subunit n=1 Tax=Tetrabaena socialis TaxID=47790 RepID=A0A2J8AHE2_9CHLO|nr:DNA-dependent protein kinase catalytic subunit [Tetrabaena socialis]|eukprot:PNH11943.1 DNA-dependent protein kinase catalytic subunit [Tetrabaena socialis]
MHLREVLRAGAAEAAKGPGGGGSGSGSRSQGEGGSEASKQQGEAGAGGGEGAAEAAAEVEAEAPAVGNGGAEVESDVELARQLARIRVATALQKLARRHPSLITADELRPLHGARPYFPLLLATVTGTDPAHPTYRGGAELLQRSGPLSPEEQARCLLDAATDPNMLGRMYYGWRPFV